MKAVIKRSLFPISILIISFFLSPFFGAEADSTLTIQPITWNVVGLDSNNVNVGPNNFPVGIRVCNPASSTTSVNDVSADFVWTSSNSYMSLRSGSLDPISPGADLAPGDCYDFYFEVTVGRNAAAYDTKRAYRIDVTGTDSLTGLPVTASSPTPRELYVEHLISQNRNSTQNVYLDGSPIAPGGTMALVVGSTYTIRLEAGTATNGYEQIESFINFPNTIFQINSVTTTYTADGGTDPAAGTKLYADGCQWDSDPNSPYYRSCLSTGKYGGTVVIDYNVTIIGGGGTNQTLSDLIYDFSGSSYHYNSDFGVGARIAAIIDPSSVTISKAFNPGTTNVDGISTLTFMLTNPNGAALNEINFTDTFPASPGAMTVASPLSTTNTCGGSLSDNSGGILNSGDAGIRLSGGVLPADGSCTLSIEVTAPSTGTYSNLSDNVFIGTVDTTHNASATLIVNDTPAPPPPTCGFILAEWLVPPTASNPPDTTGGIPTTLASDVPSAVASAGIGLSPVIRSNLGHNDNGSWNSDGGFEIGAFNPSQNNYFRFAVDTQNYEQISLTFWARRTNNGPQDLYVYYGTTGSPPESLKASLTVALGSGLPSQNTWYQYTVNFLASETSTTGVTYFYIYGANSGNSNPGSDLFLDEISFTGCKIPDPPTISKIFSPDPIAVNGVSTLTFSLTNPNPTALTGLTFTDDLPTGLQVASLPNASTTCLGPPNWSPSASDSSLTFGEIAGGTIPANSSCTVQVDVTATTAGPHANVSGYVSSVETGTNSGAGGSAADTLTAVLPPEIAKQFSPNPILAGGTSTLTFTITNPNPNDALSGIAFTDTFPTSPGSMTVASPLSTSSTCGGSLLDNLGGSLAAGDAGISLTGGALAGGANCTITVDVTVPITPLSGTYANTTSNVSHLINATTVNGNAANDSLLVNAPSPAINLLKQVGPHNTGPWSSYLAVATGADVFYRFTVENSGDVPLDLVAPVVTDIISSVDTLAATCSWRDYQGNAVALPTTLPVANASTDAHIITCVTSSISALAGTNQNTATATGTYNSAPYTDSSTAIYATTGLTIDKSSTESTFLTAGEVLDYSYLVSNTGSAALRGPVTINDDKAVNESCPAVNTVGDFDDFLDPGESITCTASYATTGADVTTMSVTNTAEATVDGVTSPIDTVTVTLLSPPTVTKGFIPPSINVGGTSLMVITLNNPGGTDLTGVGFTDTYPAAVFNITPNDASTTCQNGVISATDGGGSVALSGATLPAGTACTVSVTVSSVTPGSHVNVISIGDVTTDEGVSNNTTATDTLTVTAAAPTVTKSFSPDTIAAGGTSTLTLTLRNTNGVAATLTAPLVDTLPANVAVAATPNVGGTCTGTVTAVAGGATITYASGSTIPAGGCTITVDVTSSTAGTHTNTIAAGNLQTDLGNNGSPASDDLVVLDPPSISKVFSPDTILTGGASTLTFTITNPNASTALTGVAFTDNLPAGVEVAGTPNASTTGCGTPTWSPAAGDTSLNFSAGTIAASGTCTVAVDVTATTAGVKVNTSGNVSSTNGGTGNSASDTLTVTSIAAPSINKLFAPDTIAEGDITTLTFTIVNPSGNTVALTGVAFTDGLPAGVEVAGTPNASTTGCGSPTWAPSAGNTTLNFSGGTVAVDGTCTVAVDVTGTTAGTKVNTSGNVTSTNGGQGNTATDTLTVVGPPGMVKAFSPDTILTGETSTLTFTITNPNASTALTGVVFTDNLPAGVEVAGTPNASTTGCGTPAWAPGAANTSLNFSAGTIAASGTCTVEVDVTATSAGSYNNTSGAVTSTNGGTGNTASDTLTVSTIAVPGVTKAFSPDSITVGGTSTLTITITNPNGGTGLTGVGVSDTYPGGMVNDTPLSTSNTCGGTLAAAAGGGSLSLSGGSIAAGGSCQVSVDVTSSTPGTVTNTTSVVTSTEAPDSGTASDDLTLTAGAPTVTKAFSPDTIAAGGTSTLTLTLGNTNGVAATLTASLVDTLPANVVVAGTPNVGGTCTGTVTAAAGGATITYASGSTIPSGGCTITVDVTSSTAGTHTNTVAAGDLQTDLGANTTASTDDLLVIAPPSISKGFSPNPVNATEISTLTFVLTNPNLTTALSGVGFTDTLPTTPGAMVIASPANASSGCGGSLAAFPGSGTVSFSGGAIPADSDCSISVDVTAPDAGVYANISGLVSSTNGGTGNRASASLIVGAATISDPAVTKTGDPSTAQVGDLVTFTLDVFNNGNAIATDVVVTDPLPNFLDYVTVSAPGATTTNYDAGTNTLTITYATVAPGDAFTITVTTRVNDLGEPPGGTNTVDLVSSTADSDPTNNVDATSIAIVVLSDLIVPETGFAPDRISSVPEQPDAYEYEAYGELSLSIPALGLNSTVVGVPFTGEGWDVTWLWNQVGYLDGTAFPGWDGNSVLTGHVYLPSGLPGPFVGLKDLVWGDKVIIESFGTRYVYEVRESRLFAPDDDRIVRHEESPWLTLLTCQSFDEETGSYRWRRVVRAVLIEVASEP